MRLDFPGGAGRFFGEGSLHDHFDFRLGRRRRRIVGEADHDLDRFAAPVGHLAVEAELDAAEPAAGQVAHGLNPKLVEVTFFFAETPTPGLVEAKEHAAAGADELLQDERMPAFAGSIAGFQARGPWPVGFGRATRMDSQDFGRRLGPISL